MFNRGIRLFSILIVLLILTTSCKSDDTVFSDELREELAQDFMTELRDEILPLRNKADQVADLGLVVTTDWGRVRGTHNMELINEFYSAYESGRIGQLTAMFDRETSLVIIRLDLNPDGTGYYFRYILDEDEPISVYPKEFTGMEMELKGDADDPSRIALVLKYRKSDLATFSFFYPELGLDS